MPMRFCDLKRYVGKDNPVRVIDAFVDSLDLTEAGFFRTTPKDTGRPPYNPKDLLKLYVYGYFNKIHSSRKLMIECTRNVELFFLLGKLTPDFRTIADFRKDNAMAIRNVFRAFVKLCTKLGLYQKELFAIAGSKFRAVNSKGNAYNAEIPEKKLKRIEEHINEYLSQVVLRIKEDIDKIKERMCLSEHPFGTVKWYHGTHYLLCKGKEKATATAELGLSFLAYNLKRAINMMGIEKLIAAM